ncbi:hypothetical protein C2845_PM07G13040 [Panicum miliaceum]|uniref:Kazal-like domain-containing protein n=1 Tax=Panicum miliaceum TaxID=4540 RepID=A0A3L6SIQ8_PANMI|nr:hypothetical protein C2845_PM07G13040 [Panicum miliaceum]
MASGANSYLKALTIAVACIVLVLSSSAAVQMLCCKCDQYCSPPSTDGCTSSFCGSACGNTTSPGCLSCKQAYVSKCQNLCVNYCMANCVNC